MRAEDYPVEDYRRNDPRFQGENYDINRKAAEIVLEIAAGKKAKPGQIALAWLLHKGEDIVPIPGTKRLQYLKENVSSADIVLGASELKLLDEALSPEHISGQRYPDWVMATIDR